MAPAVSSPTTDVNNQPEGPRVLLGVTGSVAAVKAPEIAVRLVTECKAHVKVLLSVGGKNFWDKAVEYDIVHWEKLQGLRSTTAENNQAGRIQVICEYVGFWLLIPSPCR
jgi:hypothetical protein